MKHITHKKEKGFSLVEMLIYIAILSMILVAIISVLFLLSRSHRAASSTKYVQSAALLSIDRMTRDIHNATTVNVIDSNLGSNPGRLSVNGIDSLGNTRNVEFYVQSGVLKVNENGVYAGQLTSSSTVVSNLIFRHIDQTVADAIRIEMQLSAGQGDYAKSETFYTTAVLRNSY
jgi:type II secretory pathway component PulJ